MISAAVVGCLFLLWQSSMGYGDEWMGILKKDTGYAFSGFEGQLLYKGEPAAGAEMTRTWDLFGDKGEDTVVADSEGNFKFDSVVVKFRTPLLAAFDFLAHQAIQVKFGEESYQIWGGGKVSKEEYYEFNGMPKNFYCEVTEPPRRVDTASSGFVVTNCHWK